MRFCSALQTTKMRFASTPLMAASSMNDLELIINEQIIQYPWGRPAV